MIYKFVIAAKTPGGKLFEVVGKNGTNKTTSVIRRAWMTNTRLKGNILYIMIADNKLMNLSDFGHDAFIKDMLNNSDVADCILARVVAEYRQLYKVMTSDGLCLAKISRKNIFDITNRESYPAVGDWVAISKNDDEKAIIVKIFPRKTILKKKNAAMRDRYGGKQEAQIVATNVDTAFIIESTDRDFNLNRLERYFVQIREGGITPVIILNKVDLISDTDLMQMIEQINSRFNDVDIIPTSTVTDTGLERLTSYLKKGRTYCFVGSSGVGKSSLINKLLDENRIKTREIGVINGRGQHTTTHREMYLLKNGGLIIDSPGSREVGLTDSTAGVEKVFDEVISLSNRCKYSNCSHTHEPGCAILEAIENKLLTREKYDNYLRLKKEAEYYQLSELEKREKNRKFGHFIKKAKKQIKKSK